MKTFWLCMAVAALMAFGTWCFADGSAPKKTGIVLEQEGPFVQVVIEVKVITDVTDFKTPLTSQSALESAYERLGKVLEK